MQLKILLIINCIMEAVGYSGGPLLTRLYFNNGGKRVWLSCFLQTAAFPLMLLPLSISYSHRRHTNPNANPRMPSMKPPLFFASAVIGVLSGLTGYLYAYAMSLLPVSTSSQLIATNLAFNAAFSFLLVKQKFTAYSVNAVVLLTVGAAVLGLHASGDRPTGESKKQYVIGFVLALVAAILGGFLFPFIQLVYDKANQTITYSLVLEIQLVTSLFASLFCLVGMIINNDFKVISREARHSELGEVNYYVVLVVIAVTWQAYYLGSMGVIFCASSLLSGIIGSAMVPVTEILAVIFYREKFQAEKVVSLVLSLWGFASYFYGEFKQANSTKNQAPQTELPLNPTVSNP